MEVDVAEVKENAALMAKALKDPETFLCEWVNSTLKGEGVRRVGTVYASPPPPVLALTPPPSPPLHHHHHHHPPQSWA